MDSCLHLGLQVGSIMNVLPAENYNLHFSIPHPDKSPITESLPLLYKTFILHLAMAKHFHKENKEILETTDW